MVFMDDFIRDQRVVSDGNSAFVEVLIGKHWYRHASRLELRDAYLTASTIEQSATPIKPNMKQLTKLDNL